MTPTRWPQKPPAETTSWPHPPMTTAVGRGLLGRCPKAHLFNGFLHVASECRDCDAPLGLARADDAPSYFTILITGRTVIPLMFVVDRMGEPPIWVMTAIFLPSTFFMAVGLLRPIKGGAVSLMLTLNMLKSDTGAE